MAKGIGGRWIQDPITGTLIPAAEYIREEYNTPFAIHGDIETFKSPIDGSIISDRKHLREHNIKHEVTDYRDYGDAYFERKANERKAALSCNRPQDRVDRINAIKRAIAEIQKR